MQREVTEVTDKQLAQLFSGRQADLAVVRPTRIYLLHFFCSGIQFYLLLNPIFALSPFYVLFYMF